MGSTNDHNKIHNKAMAHINLMSYIKIDYSGFQRPVPSYEEIM